MPGPARPAPVADWVTIPDLHRDPFPVFERLRAEGGVHWVPAVGRYLVTSYAAVHDTELDQGTFSADEEGSLMIRAMGHSMLRRDDPQHHVERRAWQPVLRPGVVRKAWLPQFERTAERYLGEFLDLGPGADLVRDFAAPYAAENLRAVLGFHNATQQDLQRWSQTMIDATGNYADDPGVWARGQASYDEVDVALDEMLTWHAEHPDDSLLSALLRLPEQQMPLASVRANVKMTIGGGLNEPRDAIGVAAWALLTHPEQRRLVAEGTSTWDAVFDETIRWVAPIGMYSRQTTRDVDLQGVHLPAGAKLGICLLSANRDERVWSRPDVFDATREGGGAHLAFGKGVHVCLGAAVARAEVAAVALPRLFERLPDLATVEHDPPQAAGWVFRGMTSLPVTWDPQRSARVPAPGPHVAVVGSGPSGCYTAQAVRKALPRAEVTVLDRLPVPYGLVRHGVAGDHQGTKAVSRQFARLFEEDGVRFVGGVEVGSDVQLAQLRSAFDAVVLAHGLHEDARWEVPGADLPGVHGAGRITRLLNGHPGEARPAPRLGAAVAVVGHGNVALDVVRLLAKRPEDLAGSDVDDEAHRRLGGDLRVLHVLGRSLPAAAKFDVPALREVLDLPGLEHVVHGVGPDTLAGAQDPRSQLVLDLLGAPGVPGARLQVHWWFGHTPVRVLGQDAVTGLEVRACCTAEAGPQETTVLDVDGVVTAIGFTADAGQRLAVLDGAARASGRIEPGLYAAGWARRGPRGTIPSQRTDARELARTIAADLATCPGAPGWRSLSGALPAATGYDGWLLIEAHETRGALPGRLRRKLTDAGELRRIAATATGLPGGSAPAAAASEGRDGPPVTIVYATESGNGELVADELADHLSGRHPVRVVDLAEAGPDVLDPERLVVLVCSTYGDGELPTTARAFHADLLQRRPDLSGLRFAVFGLGDRSYSRTYSRGSEILEETLRGLGARRVGPYGRHDAAGREAAADLARAWVDDVLQTAATAG
ncbi:cytochrome P450 [Kineococcus sp. LSe6-4]|uniref:Cytochrome P450 n=1 Tax=Kineococcus halophytocola TaxID=3234027 RepID=A0ABV4GZP7_9ACTN